MPRELPRRPVERTPVAAAPPLGSVLHSPWTGAVLGVGLVFVLGLLGTGYHDSVVALGSGDSTPFVAPASAAKLAPEERKAAARYRQLESRLERLAPRSRYIVIDQTQNRLYVKDRSGTVHEAICSAGSGMVLKEGEGRKRTWIFDTPRGTFRVLSKITNPVWKKPDWAFIEEGEPIPTNPADRLEPGTLGEYALYFGNGYMIHGTLYERLLGRSVSHGCIRLGRDDLRKVYAASPIGTPIFIY